MTPSGLDIVLALCCGWIGLCCAAVHAFSSRKRKRWLNVPEHFRLLLLVCMGLSAWRSMNLLTLSEPTAPGHANPEGTLFVLGLACLFTSGAYHFWTEVMPGYGWEKITYAMRSMRSNPHSAPVMLDPIEMAHAAGLEAIGAGETSEAVVREARRWRQPETIHH